MPRKKKPDEVAEAKRLLAELETKPRCLCCRKPTLRWGDTKLMDGLTKSGFYDSVDYEMQSNEVRALCVRCVDNESNVLETLRTAHNFIPPTEWQELFKCAVRLCVRGMRLG